MKLPKKATVGTKISKSVNIKNKKRKLTFLRVHSHGKNKNLKWKIISNKKE